MSSAPGDGERRRRGHRRAVGPVGAWSSFTEPDASARPVEEREEAPDPDADERLRRDRPPHHDQGV